MAKNIVHIVSDNGHRGAYLELFTSILNFTPVIKPINSKKNIISYLKAERVLFASINLGKTFKWYFMISTIRALLMKPTCLILLGVNFLDNPQPHIKFKKICMRLWKYLYKQTLLTITPYYLDERLSAYTKDFIYDPQMWDMYCEEYSKQCDINVDFANSQVINHELPIVVFLGQAYHRKGLKEFKKFVETNKNKAQFIIAGKIPDESLVYIEQLEELGVTVINTFLEESEFLGFYKVADYIWCYYKPKYDQTSGVFGRAIQFGVVPIVREDSKISRIAKKNTIPCVALNFQSQDQHVKISDFPQKSNYISDSFFAKIKTDALDKLKAYLYI